MHTTRLSGDDAIEVDMNMDYRYFFMSNKLYFDELSTMSLLYANSIYRRGRDQDDKWMKFHSGIVIENDNNITNILNENNKCDEFENPINNRVEYMTINEKNYKNLKIKDMMLFFGFKNVKTYYMGEEGLNKDTDPDNPADISDECRGYKDTHKGRVAIGYKNIEYHGLNKTVIGIVIRGTAEDDDWDSDFDMGDKELRDKLENIESGKNNYDKNYNNILMQLSNGILDKYDKNYAKELLHFAGGYPDWIWDYHHAGFDIVSNRILEILEEYITTYDSNFADEICFWVTGHSMGGGVANLVAASLVYGECGGNADNVYCYTFASPMTLYNSSEHSRYSRNGYLARYDSIFNVVNESDAYSFIMPQSLGFSRYGMTCIGNLDIYNPETNKFEINIESSKKIIKELENIYKGMENETRTKTYSKDSNKNKSQNYLGLYNVYQRLINAINIDRNNLESEATGDNDKKEEVDTIKEFYKRYRNVPDLSSFIKTLELNYNIIKRAGNEDVYYSIAKNMNNADIVNVVNLHDNRKTRKATGSDLYERYPNYHSLINIDINNPVPSIFQDAEVWSQFRYGRNRSEATKKYVDGGEEIDHSNDVNKEENKRRKIKIYNDTDYPYGTFWESACGATSPAVVLSYLSDKQITPIDIRNRIEVYTDTKGNNFEYRPKSGGTSHSSPEKIAELYNVNCEHLINQEHKDKGTNKEYVEVMQVMKELLKGSPAIALCGSGVFAGSGHYIVIAGINTNQVNDLKRKKGVATLSEAEKETKWKEEIDKLEYNDLKDLDIYVFDPRYKHEYNRKKNEKENGKEAKTITTAWDIETFKYGGDGNATQFWIYTKRNTDINLGCNENELFDFNTTKYPSDYKEYFDPQEPSDGDKYCNPSVKHSDGKWHGRDLELGFYGKKEQHWRADFSQLK